MLRGGFRCLWRSAGSRLVCQRLISNQSMNDRMIGSRTIDRFERNQAQQAEEEASKAGVDTETRKFSLYGIDRSSKHNKNADLEKSEPTSPTFPPCNGPLTELKSSRGFRS
jgi:hypothetical protein